MNALDASVQPLPHDRRFRDRILVDHVDNADGVVLDHNVEIGNPADAPQPAPAIKLITYRTAHMHCRRPFKGTARNSYVLWEETYSRLCLLWVRRSELKADGQINLVTPRTAPAFD
jgi:hypothetical protein